MRASARRHAATPRASAWSKSPGHRRHRADPEFQGRYHVLAGRDLPHRGHRPRAAAHPGAARPRDAEGIKEVILATNPNIEGEATAMYLAGLLKPLGVQVTRIASGLPVGGDLEYADEFTLGRALEGRRELGPELPLVPPPPACGASRCGSSSPTVLAARPGADRAGGAVLAPHGRRRRFSSGARAASDPEGAAPASCPPSSGAVAGACPGAIWG